MIPLAHEQLVTFLEACGHLPRRRRGRKPHVATLYRWAKVGVRGVKLETIRVGGTLCTSLEALQRFCERLTSPGQPTSDERAVQRRNQAQAASILDQAGIR